MRIALAALFFLLALPALGQDAKFKSWDVGCGDDGHCVAGTMSDTGDVLRIGRHAQQSYWEVAVVIQSATADEWQDFVVAVDGQPETFSLRSEIGAYGAPTDFYLLGDKAQAVMDRLAPGSEVTVSYTTTDEEARAMAFPLGGLTAALLWIDERQGRLGSERVASAPPFGLVPAGQEQVAGVPDIPHEVLELHESDPGCEPFAALANGRDFTVSALDAEHTLYLIPCWSAAYNFGWKAYVETAGGGVEPQYFADYSDYSGWTGTPHLVNVYFDPGFKELGSFYKGRGVGDCGSSGTWKWTGYLFRMTEFRAKACGDGPVDENEDIGNFPVIFTAPPLPPGQ